MFCQAYIINKAQNKIWGEIQQLSITPLANAEVLIKADYSSINYKDALACTGSGKILKRFPLVAGIDVAGVVADSKDARFAVGDKVLVTGCGLGESSDGGYAEFVKVQAEHVLPLPPGLSAKQAMTLGTAGFTAGLCMSRLEQNGQQSNQGPIVVTGASGGVGSLAVALLATRGYQVIAISSKKQCHGYLTELGADQVMSLEQLSLGTHALEKARFAGVIDNLGGQALATLLAHVSLWGNIACVGMAASSALEATVFPLILRGVSLLGISSANAAMDTRVQVWQQLADCIKPAQLKQILTQCVHLNQMEPCFKAMLQQQMHGRIVVKCSVS